MAAALALSAAACTNSGSSSASGTQGGDSSGTSSTVSSGVELTGEINKYGWDVPKETLKFSYFYADDDTLGQEEENERMAQVASCLLYTSRCV